MVATTLLGFSLLRANRECSDNLLQPLALLSARITLLGFLHNPK
jgi:hypothetical protein